MKNHAPQPRLCDACAATCSRIAETAPGQFSLKRCDHRDDGLSVIAVGLTLGGQITAWTIYGPLNEGKADELGVQLVTFFKAKGGQEMLPPPLQ